MRNIDNLCQHQLYQSEIAWIRDTIKPRLDAVESGKLELIDGKEYFEDRIKRLS